MGCSDEGNNMKLLESLHKNATLLEPIAHIISNEDHRAIIDLRDKPPRIEPETLAEKISESHLNLLKGAEVNFVANDPSFGGVLFEKSGVGIGISGSSTGYIYSHTTLNIEESDDLYSAFKNKKENLSLVDGSSDIKLVQPAMKNWWLYIETF